MNPNWHAKRHMAFSMLLPPSVKKQERPDNLLLKDKKEKN